MPDTTLSTDMDLFLTTANDAAARLELGFLGVDAATFRTELGLGTLATQSGTFTDKANLTGGNAFTGNQSNSGVVTITNATASSGSGNGALVITGGLGLGGNLNSGGSATFNASVQVASGGFLGMLGSARIYALNTSTIEVRLNDGTTVAKFSANDLLLSKTVTTAGTTGAATINKASGSVNFAAAATSLVVTNSLVTANSIIMVTVGTNDLNMSAAKVVAAAGSFTIYPDAPPAAETRVNFLLTN